MLAAAHASAEEIEAAIRPVEARPVAKSSGMAGRFAALLPRHEEFVSFVEVRTCGYATERSNWSRFVRKSLKLDSE